MPRNGSGVYTIYTPGNPVVPATTIDPVAFNNTTTDIATALTNSIARNGESVPTGNLPMASFKLTGLGAGTNAGDSLAYGVTTTSSLGAGKTPTSEPIESAGGVSAYGPINLPAGPKIALDYLGAGASRTLVFGNVTGTVGTWSLYQASSDNSVSRTAFGADTSGNLVPGTNNAASVGTSGLRWSNVFGVLGNFSGVLTASGGITDGTNSYSPAVSKVKTATTSRTSTTTLSDDPHLVAALGTGVFEVELFVPLWATTGSAGGFKYSLAFSGTSTGAVFAHLGMLNSVLSGTTTLAFAPVGSSGAATIVVSTSTAAADFLRISASLTVTVAGNISFQWAQNSSSVNATNVGIGASMICTKVG